MSASANSAGVSNSVSMQNNNLNNSEMKTKDIIKGKRYRLTGDIQNGSFVTHEDVVRKVTRITDQHIVCECGRHFIINENLKISEVNYERYNH